jgi:hypothetical protein
MCQIETVIAQHVERFLRQMVLDDVVDVLTRSPPETCHPPRRLACLFLDPPYGALGITIAVIP